ncbi:MULTISPECIES: hypothetical protein [Acidithrix]|uniref:Uncharacterized protein n=1 Tax=Acidithrix ferrooxidans TaxID=1280514 RepID=A0A0D8HCF1_9ACTN|nr:MULTISPECIES: hypothetical protein [Acidithrix]KJF15564.1 hypothetical protein AXFE_35890 [Acidithrix ferrooxidans]
MGIKRITERIGVGLGALALSSVAVGLTGSAAWASGAPRPQTPKPALICKPGGTCGSVAYWAGEECDNPGDYALDPYGTPLECHYVGTDAYGSPIFIWVEA